MSPYASTRYVLYRSVETDEILCHYRILETFDTSDGKRTRIVEGLWTNFHDAKLKLESLFATESDQRGLHEAYLRLRNIIGPAALNTPTAPTPGQIWQVTEDALKALVREVGDARILRSQFTAFIERWKDKM